MIQTFSEMPFPGKTLMLHDAIEAFLGDVAVQQRELYTGYLEKFERYLGAPAPLLAYTRLTGEAWKKTLAKHEQPTAEEILSHFRSFLRDTGWFDAARPVNQFD